MKTVENKTQSKKKTKEIKEEIKKLVNLQKKEKDTLRSSHNDLSSEVFTSNSGQSFELKGISRASHLMFRCKRRANKITQLHIEYNKIRGKNFDMYLGKQPFISKEEYDSFCKLYSKINEKCEKLAYQKHGKGYVSNINIKFDNMIEFTWIIPVGCGCCPDDEYYLLFSDENFIR